MATDQTKSSNPGGQEHLQPHPIVTYPPQQYGTQYPPPVSYPPYYTYAPVPDGAHDPNVANGAPPPPYFMALPPPPPGMVYAYPAPPPGQGYPPYPPPISAPAPPPRQKRKQVKMACTNCASACKRCDESRPCERCVKYGIADTCVDGVRKERKKGIKRGPYKRKNKTGEQPANGDPSVPPTPYVAPPEGYYPYVYPHAYVPPPHDGQPHPEGIPAGAPPHVAHPPYYPGYPVYAPYPPYPGAPPMPYAPQAMPAPAVPVTAKPPESTVAPAEVNGDSTSKGKKRSRGKSGEDGGLRSKKSKHHADPAADGEVGRAVVQAEAAPVYANVESRTMVAV